MTDDELDAFIEAGCRLLAIPIRDEWRAAIRLHLAISLDHARNVGTFGLPDDTDPAPVFTA
jgi:Protein of unknown function (DUF4089)